jgi:hypothetical protein
VIKFQNISDFVKKQSERSLKMAFEAKNSDADYFKHLYTQNGAGFFESETGLTYYFLGSVFRIYKRNSDGFEKGNYSIKGNYIFIRESSASYSYFQIPIKLHFKPAGPEAIFINGNKCKRIDRTWTDEWEGWRMDE